MNLVNHKYVRGFLPLGSHRKKCYSSSCNIDAKVAIAPATFFYDLGSIKK